MCHERALGSFLAHETFALLEHFWLKSASFTAIDFALGAVIAVGTFGT